MSHIEILAFLKVFCLFFFFVPLVFSHKANAQASVLASTPDGTKFCSTADATTSVDMGSCTDALLLPIGSTSQRPASAANGMFRFNNTTSNIEAYSGGSWWSMAPQINADWNASSGIAQIFNKPTNVSIFTNDVGYITNSSLSSYLTSSAAASAYATILSVNSKLTIPTGSTNQYLNGVGVPTSFPSSITKTFNYPSRALNNVFQISTTQDAYVNYSVSTACTALILAGELSTVTLEYADNNSMTTNLKTVNVSTNSISGVLNVASQSPGNVHGWVPAGKYVEILTSTSGTACALSLGSQQEVLM